MDGCPRDRLLREDGRYDSVIVMSLVDSKYRLHHNGPSRLDTMALVAALPLRVPSDPWG